MKKISVIYAILLIASLAACEDVGPAPMRVIDTPPSKITFDVETIDLADRSGPVPDNSPYNTNHFSPTITDAIRKWAKDRLVAGGQAGHAAMVIKDASFIAEEIPTDTGIQSWFKREQGVKYVAHADVYIEANNPSGYGMTEATASRSMTLPEHPTATEKQDAYYTLINGLMKDLGNDLEAGIASHLFKFTMVTHDTSMSDMTNQALSAPMLSDVPVVSNGSSVTSAPLAGAPITNAPITSTPIADAPVTRMVAPITKMTTNMPSPVADDPIIIDGDSNPMPMPAPAPAPMPMQVQQMPNAPVLPATETVTIPLSGPMVQR